VVSRLAARHHIKVSLRPSPYGGITAVVLLPFGVIVREEDASLADDPRNWPVAAAAGAQDVRPAAMLGHQITPWPDALKPAAARQVQPPEALSVDGGAHQPRGLLSRPPAGAEQPGPTSSGSHLGMPVRVPQASLAPQLRGRPEFGWWTTAPEEPSVDERPPEVTANMMASMQQGWQRGRVDDLDDPEGAPSNGTD
jgi:hypothetical protein